MAASALSSTFCYRPMIGIRLGVRLAAQRTAMGGARAPAAGAVPGGWALAPLGRPLSGGSAIRPSFVAQASWGWDDEQEASAPPGPATQDRRGGGRGRSGGGGGGRDRERGGGGRRERSSGPRSRGRDFGSDEWRGGGRDGGRAAAEDDWGSGGGGWGGEEEDGGGGRRSPRGGARDGGWEGGEDSGGGGWGDRSGGRAGRRDSRPTRGGGGGDYRGSSRGGGGRGGGGGNAGQWRRGDGRDRGPPQQQQWQRRDEDKGPTLKDLLEGEAVYGVTPVLAALKAGRRTAYTLHVQENLDSKKRKDAGAVAAAISAAASLGAKIEKTSKHDLNMVADNRPHQGLVLDASPLEFVEISALPMPDPAGPPPVWLALDEVWDPQNFGAVLRSAHFLRATGVVTCSRNSAPLSPSVSKASAGAMEAAPIHSVNNMPKFLESMAAAGWRVVGAAAEPGALRSTDLTLDRPTIVVMGNEGYGLRTNVKRACGELVQIGDGAIGVEPAVSLAGVDGVGEEGAGVGEEVGMMGGVDSLNVSVATGILLYQLTAGRAGAAAPRPLE